MGRRQGRAAGRLRASAGRAAAAGTAIAAVGAGTVFGLAAPAQAVPDLPLPPDRAVPFQVDSGDTCLIGFTRGLLIWPGSLPATGTVGAAGFVQDGPVLRPPPPPPCGPDELSTVALFKAYSGGAEVDSERVAAVDGRTEFEFELGVGPEAPVEAVTVQVCRRGWRLTFDYCGEVQTFKRP